MLENKENAFKMRFEPLGQKIFPRRQWLLRWSILINITMILYICSHAIIDNRNNLATGLQLLIQEQQTQSQQQNVIRETLGKSVNVPKSTAQQLATANSGKGAGVPFFDIQSANNDGKTPEMDLNVLEPVTVTNNIVPGGYSYINNSQNKAASSYMVTGYKNDFDKRLRSVIKCYEKPYEPKILQRGDFWVLKNYVRAEHSELKCHESITYTTHADYTFLDNVIPLLERWNAPISIAMHAPGTDFQPTLDSINYLRDCLPKSNLVRSFATFHLFFSNKYMPKTIPSQAEVLKMNYNCSLPAPYVNVTSDRLYKTQKNILYPINVGRNIARDAALTHFILASDIELYPNPGLVKQFLQMIARNESYLQRKSPRVFPLAIFEVKENSPLPRDKTELQELLRTQKSIQFHQRICSYCHRVPKSKEWIAANMTEGLSVFHIGKRMGEFSHWEPIYIGTNAEPLYDERLSWEGRSDKMTQGYALCVLDYEFHILDNAFLVHKPGIKVFKKNTQRDMLSQKTNIMITYHISPELKILYGTRKGCGV